MNKTIRQFTFLVFTSILLSSCGLTIVKRQHTGGYYVSTNPHQHAAKGETIRKTDENPSEVALQSVPVKSEEIRISEPVETSKEQEINQQSTSVSTESNVTTTTERTSWKKSISEKVPMMKKMNSVITKMKSKSNSSASSDGLSLIWILILVLIILWIFGFIGGGWGLGGLINLLLVIALILLILWLLRII